MDLKKATTLASVTVMTFMLAGGYFVKVTMLYPNLFVILALFVYFLAFDICYLLLFIVLLIPRYVVVVVPCLDVMYCFPYPLSFFFSTVIFPSLITTLIVAIEPRKGRARYPNPIRLKITLYKHG